MAFATFICGSFVRLVSRPDTPAAESVFSLGSSKLQTTAEVTIEPSRVLDETTARSEGGSRGSSPVSQPEQNLLRRLRSGDSRAFAELVSRFQPGLVRRARSLVLDNSMTDDLVQETWLAVIRGISGFEGRSALQTWILSILHNRAKTMLQKQRRTISLTDDIVGILEHGHAVTGFSKRSWTSEIVAGFVPRPTENQESALLSRERYGQIRNAIMLLPERQRLVLELRAFRGISAQAVSAKLGLSEGNQRVLLHRARLNVKHALRSIQYCGLAALENSRKRGGAEISRPNATEKIIHREWRRRERALQQTACVSGSGAKN